MKIDLEVVLMQELLIMADESMKRHVDAERVHNEPAARMALGQLVMCQHMMEYYLQLDVEDDQYRDFIAATEAALELQKSLYRDARQTQDRNAALITLGRIRLVKTLFRRLADADRQKMHHTPAYPSGLLH